MIFWFQIKASARIQAVARVISLGQVRWRKSSGRGKQLGGESAALHACVSVMLSKMAAKWSRSIGPMGRCWVDGQLGERARM